MSQLVVAPVQLPVVIPKLVYVACSRDVVRSGAWRSYVNRDSHHMRTVPMAEAVPCEEFAFGPLRRARRYAWPTSLVACMYLMSEKLGKS